MPAARVIARLDVKGPNLVKGIHLEGLRVIGDPQAFARRYYADGADEILYVDIVASLYGRNNILEVVRRTAEAVFVPMTVAGGLRSLDDVRDALRSGADKVAINTAAVARPELIREVSEAFGSQCMVLSIQAKRSGPTAGRPTPTTAASAPGSTPSSGRGAASTWARASCWSPRWTARAPRRAWTSTCCAGSPRRWTCR